MLLPFSLYSRFFTCFFALKVSSDQILLVNTKTEDSIPDHGAIQSQSISGRTADEIFQSFLLRNVTL